MIKDGKKNVERGKERERKERDRERKRKRERDIKRGFLTIEKFLFYPFGFLLIDIPCHTY